MRIRSRKRSCLRLNQLTGTPYRPDVSLPCLDDQMDCVAIRPIPIATLTNGHQSVSNMQFTFKQQ